MIRQNFNHDWKFTRGSLSMMAALTGGETYDVVQLPHDAMVHEERTPDTKNGAQTGFWPGGNYTYKKEMDVPKEWEDLEILLEFEGVYETAMVYVNDNLVATQLYGYSNFYAPLNKYLNYGEKNEIVVMANNSAERNSRWYSGSGIYRNVNLLVGERIHIQPDGVKIATPEVSSSLSLVEITVTLKNITRKKEMVRVETTILEHGSVVGADNTNVTMLMEAEEQVRQRIAIESPKLWDCDNPNLYECQVKIFAGDNVLDSWTDSFGVRSLTLDATNGLCINGKQVKLRGAYIHHDNGVIGATTLQKAEDKRCREMKEAGFNSIRSAHHPISREMLSACDRYGMLVMDELSDMWTRHKNPNDYALHFREHMDDEIRVMVNKDYNHPSVVIYSVGNEIPDLGNAAGAQMNRHICNMFHELDASRYTTNAINGMLVLGDKMGLILRDLQEKQAQQEKQGQQEQKEQNEGMEPKEGKAQKEEGASALNSMMALIAGPVADAMACHPIMTETIEEASQAMDIIGLNYLTGRHVLEHELHPNQTVVGTETFPADIVRLWDIVKNHNHVIGDFTWTGYDYLGEAGLGMFYYDGNQNFNAVYPDRMAYIGDINLIGYRRPISYLREIVFGLRKRPCIAVERVDKYGMPYSRTAWMSKDNVASWTWPGYEGKNANVDVYSNADEVELFLNGTSFGRKPAGEAHGFTASYEITYEAGELKAVSYVNGEETGIDVLRTAKAQVQLTLDCREKELVADGADLAFITVKLEDDNHIENLWEQRTITVNVEGAGTLQGFGNADPRALQSYDDTSWPTFDGEVMSVVRSAREPGEIKVTFQAQGCAEQVITIPVVAQG